MPDFAFFDAKSAEAALILITLDECSALGARAHSKMRGARQCMPMARSGGNVRPNRVVVFDCCGCRARLFASADVFAHTPSVQHYFSDDAR